MFYGKYYILFRVYLGAIHIMINTEYKNEPSLNDLLEAFTTEEPEELQIAIEALKSFIGLEQQWNARVAL